MEILRRKLTIESCFLAVVLMSGLFFSYCILQEYQKESFILYGTFLVFSLIISVFGQQVSYYTIRKITLISSFLLLGFPMAFRMQTGIDDNVYETIFENVDDFSLIQYFLLFGVEKGYLSINYILFHLTNGNYNIAQAIITFSSFILWGVAVKGQCSYKISIPIVLLLIFTHYYFFILSAGLVRIFIAIPIVLYGLQFIWKGEPKKFTYSIIVASFFHISALSMLLFLLFTWRNGYFYKHLVLFLAIIFALLFASFIFVARFLVPLLGERYAGYGEISTFGISIGNFDIIPILFIAIYLKRCMSGCSQQEQQRYTIGLVLLSLSVIFSILSSMVSLGRLIYYANLGLIIVMSTIFGIRKKNKLLLCIKLILIVYTLFYLMHTTILNPIQNETLFPYKSFLFQFR